MHGINSLVAGLWGDLRNPRERSGMSKAVRLWSRHLEVQRLLTSISVHIFTTLKATRAHTCSCPFTHWEAKSVPT